METDIQMAPSILFCIFTPQISKLIIFIVNLFPPKCLIIQSSETLGFTFDASSKTGTVPKPGGSVSDALNPSFSLSFSHFISTQIKLFYRKNQQNSKV